MLLLIVCVSANNLFFNVSSKKRLSFECEIHFARDLRGRKMY